MACSLEDFEARRRHLVRGLSRIVHWKIVGLATQQQRGTCDLMPATPYLVTRLGLVDCDAAIDLELEPPGAISACGLKRVVEGKVSMRIEYGSTVSRRMVRSIRRRVGRAPAARPRSAPSTGWPVAITNPGGRGPTPPESTRTRPAMLGRRRAK